MKIVLLGRPGVGKGTYDSMIKEKYHLTHISTGDLFREAVAKGTDLGKKAKEYMDKGRHYKDIYDTLKQDLMSYGSSIRIPMMKQIEEK